MSTHKYINLICCGLMVLAVILTMAVNAYNGISGEEKKTNGTVMGYEDKLFDTSTVHTVDIRMEDWDSFLETATEEKYSLCNVVIDGEEYNNIGIRAKGNTSLSSVASIGNNRYSFKIEFDKYQNGYSYYGLDKLCLNNIYADNTYMKDYLCYTMMKDMGVASPLCSYVYITVNGEDWGLYLAVEGIEEGFLERNYGSNYGNLYKPDTASMGGGVGRGKDFNEEDIQKFFGQSDSDEESEDNGDSIQMPEMPGGGEEGAEMPSMPDGGDGSQMPAMPQDGEGTEIPAVPDTDQPSQEQSGFMNLQGEDTQMPATSTTEDQSGEMPSMPDGGDDAQMPAMPDGGQMDFGQMNPGQGGGGGDMGSGMGSADVKLQYIDDDIDSYSNIFDSAKTNVTTADKERLIASLKSLSEQENLAQVVDVESVIKYFVVHNFVCNGDSYTGSMVHNYYLYEDEGTLSMIPWDYNLAFGGFGQMGSMGGTNQATSEVNSPIDSPVSSGDISDRPMVAWIFSNQTYTDLYHIYYAQFMEDYFENGYMDNLIAETVELISPYVEKDPTAFCTYEEFETGVEAVKEFLTLRSESVIGQLEGTIPSTSEGQKEDTSSLIDASDLNINDMGQMNMGNDRGGDKQKSDGFGQDAADDNKQKPDGFGQDAADDNKQKPDGFGQDAPGGDKQKPDGSDRDAPDE